MAISRVLANIIHNNIEHMLLGFHIAVFNFYIEVPAKIVEHNIIR